MYKIPEILTPYYITPIIFDQALHFISSKVLSDVLRYCLANPKGTYFKSIGTIATERRISQASVKKALVDLVTRGILIAKKRPGKSTIYIFNRQPEMWYLGHCGEFIKSLPEDVDLATTQLRGSYNIDKLIEDPYNKENIYIGADVEKELPIDASKVAETDKQAIAPDEDKITLRPEELQAMIAAAVEKEVSKRLPKEPPETDQSSYQSSYTPQSRSQTRFDFAKKKAEEPTETLPEPMPTPQTEPKNSTPLAKKTKSDRPNPKSRRRSGKNVHTAAADENDNHSQKPVKRYAFQDVQDEIERIRKELGEEEGHRFFAWCARELNQIPKVNTPNEHLLISYLLSQSEGQKGLHILKGYYEVYIAKKKANQRTFAQTAKPERKFSDIDEEGKAIMERIKGRCAKT